MSISDRPISQVLQDIVHNIQLIVRSEILLAKAEIREEAKKAKSAGTLVAVGLAGVGFGFLFLLLAAVYALAIVVPHWAAALIVAACLLIVAGVILNTGIAQWKRVNATPEKAIESIKENVEWAKQQIK